MRLTSDVVHYADQELNCVGDRELVLRNRAIPAIENLAVAKDGFDTIDLSANMISVLGDGFPPFPRLQSLYLGANHITRILRGVADSLPNLRVLVLTANRITNLDDLNLPELSRFAKLETLSILDNPVSNMPGVRQQIIEQIPSLSVLNFTKVTQEERKAARKSALTSRAGKRRREDSTKTSKRRRVGGKDVAKPASAATDGNSFGQPQRRVSPKAGKPLTKEQSEALKNYIQSAVSVEEVSRMQNALRNGTVSEFLQSICEKQSGTEVKASR